MNSKCDNFRRKLKN